jgi:hypothetical protein
MTKHEAPGLSWSSDKIAFWRCPKRLRKAGYSIDRIRLPGHRHDGLDADRARLCREYQRDAEMWFDGLDVSKVEVGTWHHLIARYRGDEFSPIRDVKANTRASYLWQLERWDAILGEIKVAETDYGSIRRIERAMRDNGRSDSYIHRLFTMLRTVVSYGKMVKMEGARDVADILSEIRFKTAPSRNIAPTRDQIEAIVAAADERGMHGYACGLLIQYELTLRGVDVFGQWLPADGSGGGIVRDGKRWQDGLTWDMVEPDLRGLSKVISKTSRTMPDPIRFDLTSLPAVQERLRLLANGGRIGPVVLTERHGTPYTIYGRSQAFRRLRDACGLPASITMMDTRAGAVTEAKNHGADPMQMRDAAQHSNISTTSNYARDRDANVAKVVKLRRGES